MDINLQVLNNTSNANSNLTSANLPLDSKLESKTQDNATINITNQFFNSSSISNPALNSNQSLVNSTVQDIKNSFNTFVESVSSLLQRLFGDKPMTSTYNPPVSNSATPNSVTPSSQTTTVPRQIESFVEHVTKNIGSGLSGKLTEESIRENVIMYQLYQKDADAEKIFKDSLDVQKKAGKTSDDAIKAALKEVEAKDKIARWESDWVYSLSFGAAQLDQDKSIISKDGGLNAKLAIQTAERNLVAIATGVEVPVSRTIG